MQMCHPGPTVLSRIRENQPFFIGRRSRLPLHGTSTFATHTVLPEIAIAKVRQDAPLTRSATSAAASPPASKL
jgi:Zn-dependent alcohol dehydrogenase